MGNLKPGTKYIYEQADGVTYAREFGTTERQVVGYAYERDPLDYRNYQSDPKESQLWHNIRMKAQTDPALQAALDRVKVQYYLSVEKDLLNQNIPPGWHPV